MIYLPGRSAFPPAPLDLSGRFSAAGTEAAAIGFGLLYTAPSSSSDTTSSTSTGASSEAAAPPDAGFKPLQSPAQPYRAQLSLLDKAACSDFYSTLALNYDAVLCAGQDGVSTCNVRSAQPCCESRL